MKRVQLFGQEVFGVAVVLEGITPILMHNGVAQWKAASQGGKIKRIPTPEEEAEMAAYRDEEGYLVMPSIAIRAAVREAARQAGAKIKGSRIPVAKLVEARVVPTSEWAPLYRNGERLREYAIDIRRAVVQKQGVLRARPRIDLPWELRAEFALDEEDEREAKALADLFVQFLALAGRQAGIGDYRPARGGPFGQFRVKEVE